MNLSFPFIPSLPLRYMFGKCPYYEPDVMPSEMTYGLAAPRQKVSDQKDTKSPADIHGNRFN